MYLYFQRRNGDLVLISDKANEDNVFSLIRKDVKKKNPDFKIHYIRSMKHTAGIEYDVGSWTEFYWLMPEKVEVKNINDL